jgi:NAD+ synthase (glutamine-hydrolysing)
MERIVVAAAALNQTPLAWTGNCAAIERALGEARKGGARIVCLPELCITGYGCEDAFHSSGVLQHALSCAERLARTYKDIVFNVGLPLDVGGVVYNTVALIAGGAIRGFVAKQHLAGDGLHYEPRWFKPWPKGVVSSVQLGERSIPVGDLLFQVDGLRIGFEICEDAWVTERSGIELARHGVDIVLNPSASHFAFGKHEIRQRLVLEGSRAFGAAYLYANLLGCEAGRIIYDGDTLIASHGEIVARGGRFSYRDVEVVTGVANIDRGRLMRRRSASLEPRFDIGDRLVVVPRVKLSRGGAVTPSAVPTWEGSRVLKHEEFSRAVCLGLFDYLRKSRSEGFVVSLSGGVDSSAASALVALMVRGAVAQLGLKGFKERLAYVSWIKGASSEAQILQKILACVYQRSVNSSETTHRAARELAHEMGATFLDLDISDLVSGYESLVSKAMHVELSWRDHDLAKQNIQARVRSPSVWLVANLRKALLLTTSNRSEAAVGYTTMDGDSSGGLSPLGGIDKAYLCRWLVWLEREGPEGLGTFTSLRLVNEQEPTAELRPLKDKQTDERDLMPYEVLDRIERLAIRDKLLPTDVAEILKQEFQKRYKQQEIVGWVVRFFRLWSINQWKRERYAPSFHVDDESLDPKTWCRFPILSGGFAEELAELEAKSLKRSAKRKR